jgi:hypothetical protein
MGAASSPAPRGRPGRAVAGTRSLVRLVYRDPEHLAERLTLYAADALGPASQEWADAGRRDQPDAQRAHVAEDQRLHTAGVARIDGAVAGTPFFIALVPGYVGYLWEEMRMALRIAALYGRDPASLRTAAEVLALRGVHPTVDAAEQALRHAQARPLPDAPATRRPVRTWYDSVYRLLIFGGFLDAPDPDKPQVERSRLRAAGGIALGAAIWAVTWVLPVTFMVAMAWACESHARALGTRAIAFYDGDAASAEAAIATAAARRDGNRDARRVLRGLVLGLSIAIPIAFVAYVGHIRNTVGINWLGAVGALVALSLVAATSVAAARR